LTWRMIFLDSLILKMETLRSFRMAVNVYQSTRRNVSEGLNQQHRENLKSRTDWKYLSTNTGEIVVLWRREVMEHWRASDCYLLHECRLLQSCILPIYFIWRLAVLVAISLRSRVSVGFAAGCNANSYMDLKCSFLLQAKEGCSSEMLLPIYQTRGRLIPEVTILICHFANILIFIGFSVSLFTKLRFWM
jgi:hypothetical protein